MKGVSKKRKTISLRLQVQIQYIKSYYKSIKYAKYFRNIEGYCMFIGYPRSGHSLIGSLLDAHPDMVFAHELDVFKYIQNGFKARQIFSLILENSKRFTEVGRTWTGYSYAVPNQWNGRFRELRIVGDKKGGASSRRLGKSPELFQLLRKTMDIDQKFIHVIRNPYDNISTISRRRKQILSESVDRYFSRCNSVSWIRSRVNPDQWMDIRHEALIDNPKLWLTKCCQFLGQNPSDDYLSDCASIVRESPHKTRHKAHWTRELIQRVENEIGKYPFLHSYTFD